MIYDHIAGRLSVLDRKVVDAVPPGGNWRNLPDDFPSKRIQQIRRTAAEGQGSRSTYYGRLRWDYPSYTISTYFNRPGNGCYIHPAAPRLITIREAARLQGFPDQYRFFGQGRDGFVQVGNAVPPLLAYQLAMTLKPGPFVDLFSGAGGLSLGFEWAGFEVKAAIDFDVASNETFQRNRDDDVSLRIDLSDPGGVVSGIRHIRSRTKDDGLYLLTGGPPCQGFSTAGNCRPDDDRNQLMFAFLTIVEELRPQIVLIENVAALMWRGRSILYEILSTLHKIGYDASVALLHAEGYGLAQLRRRLFILASYKAPVSWPHPWRRIMDPAHLKHQPYAPNSDEVPPSFTVKDAIGDLPLDESPSSDEALAYHSTPDSELQRWARGDLSLKEFIDVRAHNDFPDLFANAEAS